MPSPGDNQDKEQRSGGMQTLRHIEIRRPRTEDIEVLDQFFRTMIIDTFQKEGIGHLIEDIKEEIENKKKILREDLESCGVARKFYIALEQGQIVGSIEYGPSSKLIEECTDGALKDYKEVGTVFVHPSCQGHGIGHLLWNVIILDLLNKGIMEFCLDSGYPTAQKIWSKKFGEPDYVMRNYWGEGHHHMIWSRTTTQIPVLFRL